MKKSIAKKDTKKESRKNLGIMLYLGILSFRIFLT
jgi:hypothetical protein